MGRRSTITEREIQHIREGRRLGMTFAAIQRNLLPHRDESTIRYIAVDLGLTTPKRRIPKTEVVEIRRRDRVEREHYNPRTPSCRVCGAACNEYECMDCQIVGLKVKAF